MLASICKPGCFRAYKVPREAVAQKLCVLLYKPYPEFCKTCSDHRIDKKESYVWHGKGDRVVEVSLTPEVLIDPIRLINHRHKKGGEEKRYSSFIHFSHFFASINAIRVLLLLYCL